MKDSLEGAAVTLCGLLCFFAGGFWGYVLAADGTEKLRRDATGSTAASLAVTNIQVQYAALPVDDMTNFLTISDRQWVHLSGSSIVRVTDDEWLLITNFYHAKMTTNRLEFWCRHESQSR